MKLLEANSTAILTGDLYKTIVYFCIEQLKIAVNHYVESEIGKSYDFLYNDYITGGKWYKTNIDQNYDKLYYSLSAFVSEDIPETSIAPKIESYLKNKSNKGEIKVFTKDNSMAHAAYHTWHSNLTPCSIFINEKVYAVTVRALAIPHYIRAFLYTTDDNNVPMLKSLSELDTPRSIKRILSSTKLNYLISVIVHEFTHNEQQIYVPEVDINRQIPKIANTHIEKNLNIENTGLINLEKDTTKYALHFVSNVEQHAMAEDSLAYVLLHNINYLDDMSIMQFKQRLNNNPSELTKLVVDRYNRRGVNIDPLTQKPYHISSDNAGGKAQRNMVTFISKVVNNWWYDKSDLLKSDMLQQFANHNKGADKRKEKNATRDYRMSNKNIPLNSISDPSIYKDYHFDYKPNRIIVTTEDLDLSYMLKPESIGARNNILCNIISKIYSNKIQQPVNVINGIVTKFELPTITLDTRKYIDEFNNIPIGLYATVGTAIDKYSPLESIMYELETTSILRVGFLDHILELIRDSNPQLPLLYFRKLSRIIGNTLSWEDAKWIKQYNNQIKKTNIEDITMSGYLTDLICDFSKKGMSASELLSSPALAGWDTSPYIMTYGESNKTGVAIPQTAISDIVYEKYIMGYLKDTYMKSAGAIHFKKAYTYLNNNKGILVPLIQKIINEIDSTYIKPTYNIALTKSELSDLRKALADIKMKMLSKEPEDDLRKLVRKLLPQYKDMIINSASISGKNKDTLRKFIGQ